jgi:adenine specific DNA methylase Mod
VSGPYDGDWQGDVLKSAVNDNDKRFHDWGQSESGMADLIERFTKPGDLILDPFLGGGTTGLVALKLNRHFIGIDNNEEQVAIAQGRLSEVLYG